jgi:hypothetical protein
MPKITPSGEYTLRIERWPVLLATQAANGQEVGTWPAAQEQRYSAKNDRLNAGQLMQQGVNQDTGLRVLRIRGTRIEFARGDRVKLVNSGEFYNVTSAPARDYDTGDTILTVELTAQQPG